MQLTSKYTISHSSFSTCEQYRTSLTDAFCKKDVLKNFAKFTGKHLGQNLFFNKTAGVRHEPQKILVT